MERPASSCTGPGHRYPGAVRRTEDDLLPAGHLQRDRAAPITAAARRVPPASQDRGRQSSSVAPRIPASETSS